MKEHIFDVALIIAGYCAVICMKEDKETAFDCPEMLDRYKRAAERYKIPYNEDGLIDTELLYNQLDSVAKRICKKVN